MPNRNKLKVAVIDYGMGNLFSVKRTCEYVGLEAQLTFNKQEILNADALILPGVGAFGDAMENIRRLDLVAPIKDALKNGKPFMGICLGMQLLMSESEEFGLHKGLGVFAGQVLKFPIQGASGQKIKVPQVGWSQINRPDNYSASWDGSLLKGLRGGEYMYFVHSFYAVPELSKVILSVSSYEGFEYCSSLRFNNIFAFQFHPEKSARDGLIIYQNFAEMVKQVKYQNA